MKKGIWTLLITAFLLTACTGPPTVAIEDAGELYSFSNATELENGKSYVWKGKGTLEKDLSKDRLGLDVFFKCPAGDITFKGRELMDYDAHPRTVFFTAPDDGNIPTLTAKDELIFVSDESMPETIILERFKDLGYSVGIAGLEKDLSGHYHIPYEVTGDDDYKYYIDRASDAWELSGFKGIDRLFFDKAGDIRVMEDTVSDGGSVMGLAKNRSYVCSFYTGTYYQDFTLRADIRIFSSMERFEIHDYEFCHANCVRICLPEYLKSGYYYLHGTGIFRYVSKEDEAAYSGRTYDMVIDWNDPVKQYDELGRCIYDPSAGIVQEKMSDPGVDENELGHGKSTE